MIERRFRTLWVLLFVTLFVAAGCDLVGAGVEGKGLVDDLRDCRDGALYERPLLSDQELAVVLSLCGAELGYECSAVACSTTGNPSATVRFSDIIGDR